MHRYLSTLPLLALVFALLTAVPVDANQWAVGFGETAGSQAIEAQTAWETLPTDEWGTYAGCSVTLNEVEFEGASLLMAQVGGMGWLDSPTAETVEAYVRGAGWEQVPGSLVSAGNASWVCPGVDSGGQYDAATVHWYGDVAVAIFRNDPYHDLLGFLTSTGQGNFGRHVAVDDTGRVVVGTEDGEALVVFEQNEDGSWARLGIPIPGGSVEGGLDQELRLTAQGGLVAATRVGNSIWLIELKDGEPGYTIDELTLSGDLAPDRFGFAIDSDGGVVVVGAPGSVSGGSTGGSVYVFRQSDLGWSTDRLRPSVVGELAAFGSSVAVSGDRIVVGAPGPADSLDHGDFHLFDFDGSSWREVELDLPGWIGSGGRLGVAVDLVGDNVLVGQPGFSMVYAGVLPDRGWFIDDDSSVFEVDIEWLASAGITKGCNPPLNTRFCPDADVTRGQMAAFLVRALDYTDNGGGDLFVDDDHSIFEADIDKLGTAGVTRGCNPPVNDSFCPDANVTRGQMAAFLVRALGYTDDGGGNLFVDDDGSVFENDIDRLGTAGVTRGCNPPINDMYCSDSVVTRGQMAAFLHRALGV